MVYVSTKLSNLNKYLKKKLSVKQISDCLFDMGMELKEFSKEKDSTLKIEVTAERFDMVHVIGVARAINYYLGFENKLKNYKINKANYKVYVKNSVSKIRPCSVELLLKI